MRIFLTLCLVVALPLPMLAQGKKKRGVQPVKIIKLDRKEPVEYAKDIHPIFKKRCFSCHTKPIDEGKFNMSSYENVMKGGKRGSPVVPGKAEKSLLYVMLTRTKRPFMPPRSEDPVTPEELALIKLWIDQGAKAPTRPLDDKIVIKPTLPPPNVTPVRAVALSPDKSTVAVGRGNQIYVYDAKSGTFIRNLYAPGLKTPAGRPVKAAHLSIVESMAFSPKGKYLVSGSFGEVHVWDVETGMLRKKIPGFEHNVVALAFSPDGKVLATAGGFPSKNGEIKFFEVGTWKLLGEVKNGHSDTVYGIAFSPDGKKVATASADKFVKVFDVPSGKFDKSFEGHTHHVLDVGWSADGKYLASAGADNTVRVWDYKKGEQTRSISAANKQVTRLKFIGKTTQVAICTADARVRFYNVTNGGNVRNFAGGSDFLYAVDVSPDGAIVVAGGQDGTVRVYNGQNGQLIKTLQPPPQTASAKKG